ncbi:MAG TPA: hypothetical protein VMB80_17940 [Candidatus Acidoferrum sp.]|nr:hypothetical protein [Candidatus Acidoferrum sp.]
MNKDAGRSQLIFVTLQLEDGQELPCEVDTGCFITTLDQSLEPKLGKRYDTESTSAMGVTHEVGIYQATNLYLGGAPLRHTGTNVSTCDFKWLSTLLGRPAMGILGWDVLQQYCIQLDFASHRIRFIDPDAPAKGLGQPFALTGPPNERIYISNNLVGNQGSGSLTAIDLGCLGDGWLTPALFQQWTNQALPLVAGQVHYPEARLGGEIYPDVWLERGKPWETGEPEHNGIGLLFLSRHLVTLNFPKRTMYLKRTSIGPLRMDVKEVKAVAKSALPLLRSLKESGHLPGWSKDDKSVAKSVFFSCSSTRTGCFTGRKTGDSSVYHFQVIRASEDSPWKLQKAWRTDANGHLIEEYPVP